MISVRRCAAAALLALGLAAGSIGSAAAQSGELNSLVDRMTRLERDLQDVQRQVYSGRPGSAPPTVLAQAVSPADASLSSLTTRMTDLERAMQELTGKIETLSFETRQIKSELQKIAQDTDYRLRALETGAPAPAQGQQGLAPQSGSPQGTAQTLVPPPSGLSGSPQSILESQPTARPAPPASAPLASAGGTPQEQYDAALSMLQQGDPNRAEAALASFVQSHGDTELGGNAYFWLGETYFLRNQYEDAARTYLDGVKKHPNGPKAPDSMLKLGMSLSALNQKAQACSTLEQVAKRYPKAPQTILQRAKLERSNAGCK